MRTVKYDPFETITVMPYNHRIRNGQLECAYTSDAPDSFVTDYTRWRYGKDKGKVVIHEHNGNAECRTCMRDLPAPTN